MLGTCWCLIASQGTGDPIHEHAGPSCQQRTRREPHQPDRRTQRIYQTAPRRALGRHVLELPRARVSRRPPRPGAGPCPGSLESVFPADSRGVSRSSHQYMWDMMRAEQGLFKDELYGIDDTLERVTDYFKAAASGSEVGRRLPL